MPSPRRKPPRRRRWPDSRPDSTFRPGWGCPSSARMDKPAALDELIQSLRCLPGVGPKSAQRMAYHLVQRDQKGATRLAGALTEALSRIRHCARCNTFTESEICSLCASARRDASLLCVVDSPGDLLMMEQSQSYSGIYFVLIARLSPLDGIGPRQIHLDRL